MALGEAARSAHPRKLEQLLQELLCLCPQPARPRAAAGKRVGTMGLLSGGAPGQTAPLCALWTEGTFSTRGVRPDPLAPWSVGRHAQTLGSDPPPGGCCGVHAGLTWLPVGVTVAPPPGHPRSTWSSGCKADML